LVISGTSIVSRVGYYKVIYASFILKIFTGLSLFLIGRDHPWIIAAFFLVESYVAPLPSFRTFKIFTLLLFRVSEPLLLSDFVVCLKIALHS